MKGWKFIKRLRSGDLFFMLLACCLSGFSVFFAAQKKDGAPMLIIIAAEDEYIYPMDTDGDYYIEGILGTSHIRVKDQKAFFIDSPCTNRVCIASMPVQRNGDWAGCLPNQILIRVENTEENSGFDAFSF